MPTRRSPKWRKQKKPEISFENESREIRKWARDRFPHAAPEELKNLALLGWLKDRRPKCSLDELRKVLQYVDKMSRIKRSALAIYEPLEATESFHESPASVRVVTGGNQSSKSFSCAIETARCALGLDPHNKYPAPRKRAGLIIFIVAWDEKSIGRRIHRYLFRWGAFDIIRDDKTGNWRPYVPDLDEHRKDESMPAPPLIPEEEIDEVQWKQRRAEVFSLIRLKNGTEIYAFPSKGDPPVGDQVDLYWIDEDIDDPSWVDEALQRLSKRQGKFIWSAMPMSRNEGLMDMLQMAEAQKDRKNPDSQAWRLSLLDNKYIHSDEKRKRVEGAAARGDDIMRLRIYGDPLGSVRRIYPMFDMSVHGLDPRELPGGNVPANWTRYLVTDPARTRCATLFAAVPPPYDDFCKEHGQIILVYRVIIIRNNTAKIYGETVAEAANGDRFYEWIIDNQHGRKHDEGPDPKPIREYYAEALKDNNIVSIAHGAEFVPASSDIAANVEAVTNALTVPANGRPKLRFLKGYTSQFEVAFPKYKNKTRQVRGVEVVDDMPDKKKGLDEMDALEYLVAHDPQYVEMPTRFWKPESWAVRRANELIKKRRDRKGRKRIVMGNV